MKDEIPDPNQASASHFPPSPKRARAIALP